MSALVPWPFSPRSLKGSFKNELLNWSSLVLFCGIFLSVGWVLWHTSTRPLQPLVQARVQITEGADRSPSEAGATGATPGEVGLPYFQLRPDRDHMGHATLSVPFNTPADAPFGGGERQESTHSLVLFQAINGGDYFLNGVWLHNVPTSTEQARWAWYRPQLIQLPNALLHAPDQPNVLTIRQSTYEPFWLIPRVYLGLSDDARFVYEITFYLAHTLASATHFFALMVGAFMLAVGVSTRHGKSYILVGWIATVWSTLYVLAMLEYIPYRYYELWRASGYFLEGILLTLLPAYVMHHIGKPFSRRTLRVFYALSLVTPAVYWAAGRDAENLIDTVWSLPMLLLYLWSIGHLAVYAFKAQKGSTWALLVQSLFTITVGFHDFGHLTGLIHRLNLEVPHWFASYALTELVYFIHLGLPFMLIVSAQIMLEERRAYILEIASHSVHLREVLATREEELRQSYANESKMERKNAASLERERIYQDVHDSIGSRLIATLFSARQGRLNASTMESQIKHCLDDLRLIINSDMDATGDIQSAVFDYCMGMETALESSAFLFQYEISDGSAIHLFPKVHMDFLRILQELVTNAIKHSGGSEILVQLAQSDTSIQLTVTDNGSGLPQGMALHSPAPHGLSGGRGWHGILQRARKIGASCTTLPVAQGTSIAVYLPLVAPE